MNFRFKQIFTLAPFLVADGAKTLETIFVNAKRELPTLRIDSSRMPNIARNIRNALSEGHPDVLNRTENPFIIDANRSAACRNFFGCGSLDEYPFASTLQGGAGARVTGVPLQEQRIQGGVMSRFYQNSQVKDGDSFRVIVDDAHE